jgi:hypothetical protein
MTHQKNAAPLRLREKQPRISCPVPQPNDLIAEIETLIGENK